MKAANFDSLVQWRGIRIHQMPWEVQDRVRPRYLICFFRHETVHRRPAFHAFYPPEGSFFAVESFFFCFPVFVEDGAVSSSCFLSYCEQCKHPQSMFWISMKDANKLTRWVIMDTDNLFRRSCHIRRREESSHEEKHRSSLSPWNARASSGFSSSSSSLLLLLPDKISVSKVPLQTKHEFVHRYHLQSNATGDFLLFFLLPHCELHGSAAPQTSSWLFAMVWVQHWPSKSHILTRTSKLDVIMPSNVLDDKLFRYMISVNPPRCPIRRNSPVSGLSPNIPNHKE